MILLLLLPIVLPIAAAALLTLPEPARGSGRWLAPWAALPALVLALTAPGGATWESGGLLLGATLALDPVGRVFLILSAGLWLAAGVYSSSQHAEDARRDRYQRLFLLTMAGNLGLPVAADLVTFYACFALMTYAAYGLVVHRDDASARRAGRLYLGMAVVGEALVFAGVALAAAESESLALSDLASTIGASPRAGTVVALLLAGFGIKAGAIPLHVWLPLAHPVAPTGASAVLSGSMIKGGLLAWLRLLPLGVAALPGLGATLAILGGIAAILGVVAGALQDDAKTTLAYSSISQMGYVNVAIGLALALPAAAPAAIVAATVFALHHGLAKGALFLGVDVVGGDRRRRAGTLAGLGLAAAALAGAPLTSGSVAKGVLEGVLLRPPPGWPEWLAGGLAVATIGTTILMLRFLVLAARRGAEGQRPKPGLAPPWLALLGAVALAFWILPAFYPLGIAPPRPPRASYVLAGLWPIAAGGLLFAALFLASGRLPPAVRALRIAPGDVLVPLAWLGARLPRIAAPARGIGERPVVSLASMWYGIYAHSDRTDALLRMEIGLTRWERAGLLLAVLVAAAFLLLAVGCRG